ncbi:MAG: single-stranded DNA-binding protein [Christensenellaceae bacterium]|jgi:single-strand DNA-binding protein|nr:single-stranded DNA-binding protein [Christensenellaceae bacterium]
MNKVILIGNLTRDPEIRATGSGTNVCSFSIAVNRRFSNKDGEKQTDFFNIVAWRQLADLCGKYLAKGRKVCVIGELQNRNYEGKDGTKRYTTEVIADEVEFLTPRGDGSERSGGYGNSGFGGDAPQQSEGAPLPEGFTDIEDDELPF